MRNCIILGSGRSGTSMVAGTLAKAGYFMGNHLIPARDGNPKGFFEDVEINKVNEEILAQVLPKRPRFIGRWLFLDRPLYGQRWLAQVPVGTKIPSHPQFSEKIKAIIQQKPFCFKDPRFCYTLPLWLPYLNDVVFVCIFRDPVSTVKSIIKEVKHEPHLHHFSITPQQTLDIWRLMYSHILEIHQLEGEWLFLHYDQVLNGEGLEKLAAFTEASIDYSFPDTSLRRSTQEQPIPKKTERLYQKLCQLAGYTEAVPT